MNFTVWRHLGNDVWRGICPDETQLARIERSTSSRMSDPSTVGPSYPYKVFLSCGITCTSHVLGPYTTLRRAKRAAQLAGAALREGGLNDDAGNDERIIAALRDGGLL